MDKELYNTQQLLQSIVNKVGKKHQKQITAKKKKLALVVDTDVKESPKKLSRKKEPKEPKEPNEPKEQKKEPKETKEPKKEQKDVPKKNVNGIKDTTVNTTMAHIETFKQNGISALEKLDESTLNEMIVEAKNAYYNSKTALMSDNLYDILEEYIKQKYPKNTAVTEIGAPITRNKVKLPYEMWSMDKIKPDTNVLASWKKKFAGPYVISCKLDGVSGLYDCSEKKPKLYTRGDGKVGQDISHLIPHLRLPANSKGLVVRGEFIMKKQTFEKKYKTTFANPRNMISGLINKQSYDEKMADVDFVVYELIRPIVTPSEQLRQIEETGFNTVKYEIADNATLSNEFLSKHLMDWRANYDYEIDGIIVADDNIHERKTGNPEHAFAFKMVLSDQIAEAKVVDVIWQASKDGYLKPRVQIEPIQLGGVKIEYATGFNGKFIEENKIGVGALVQIIRSGDVIPHIKAVTMPADITKMPTQSYVWNKTHVDILLADMDSDPDVQLKNITAFFTTLEVDGLAKGNVKRLIDADLNSVAKIIKAKKSDFEKAGFKTLADKFVKNIEDKIKEAPLADIMKASNKLGRGISGKTIELIMSTEPNILQETSSDETKYEKIKKIKGIGEVNANTFVQNIPAFLEFLRECGLQYKLKKSEKSEKMPTEISEDVKTHPLYNKKIVMTKIRDKEIIDKLKEVGGILQDNVNSETFAVIVKSKDDDSNKIKKAIEKGIPIMTPEEFKAEYMK